MRNHILIGFLGTALALAGISGCRCCCRRPACPPPVVPAPGPVVVPAPPPGTTVVPGQPVPAVPPAPAPANPDVPPGSGVQQGSFYWQPAEDHGVRLEPPIPADGDPNRLRPRPAPRMPRVEEKSQDQGKKDTAPSFPVGIRQFAQAKEGVASGLKPSLEGLDWLKENGYRAVLFIREPGTDDAAAKKQVTQRGMKYFSLEVSPDALSQGILDEFARAVADTKNQPLFVYDKDGMLAGGLWYLYFRTVEKDDGDTARMKAARLGLSEDAQGDHQTMWLAIQKFLRKAGQD